MALDYRQVTITEASKIIGCSVASVRGMVRSGQIGVMNYESTRADRRTGMMLSQEDVEFARDQRSFNEFGMRHRRVIVLGTNVELVYTASSALGVAGFAVERCKTALAAFSVSEDRPVIVICPPIEVSDMKVLMNDLVQFDSYCFDVPGAQRQLVRWAWQAVKARHESFKLER